jgi:hypothetical protein
MYQHMKNKHALDPNAQATIQQVSTMTGGKRGRPPKNRDFASAVDPTTDVYLNTEGRKGGPIDPVSHF